MDSYDAQTDTLRLGGQTRTKCDLDTLQVPEETGREIPPFFPMKELGLGNELPGSFIDRNAEDMAKERIHCRDSKLLSSTDSKYEHLLRLIREELFDCVDDNGNSLLNISVLQADDTIVHRMIQQAPDFTRLCVANNLGQTALHLAVLTNRSLSVRRLICAGAAVDVQDNSGNSPLHLACALGYTDIVAHLLKPVEYQECLANNYQIPFQAMPFNMRIRNINGFTCLHLAILNDHVDVVRLLLEARIGTDLENDSDWLTALQLATESGNEKATAILLEKVDTNPELDPDIIQLSTY